MIIIPAIDIKGGRCVRLVQGELDNETVYSEDPVEMALRWVDEGAQRLHLVDLDGAVAGRPVHLRIVEKIAKSVKIPVQIGGGIRQRDHIDRYLMSGVSAVILGTTALKDPDLLEECCRTFPKKIFVGIDSRKGRAAIQGWTEQRKEAVTELAVRMESAAVAALILTDIEKDGMLEGPNFALMEAVSRVVKIPLIASGGITTIEQIQKLAQIPGVGSAIVGKALYEGRISLPAAIAAAKGET
ncbi:MAG: 1-(5-phosphoribosyl)-5-[(5-phosphoribosylamino)methylideneamino]imidazole-4-carboxamide isomerase [Nitrospiria bacterium]